MLGARSLSASRSVCQPHTEVPEVARSAVNSGLAGESHCHEASGALATPGEPSRQARRGALAKVRSSGQPPAPNTTKAQAPRAGLYPGELGGARQGRERSQELPNVPGPHFCCPPVPLAASDPSHVGGPGVGRSGRGPAPAGRAGLLTPGEGRLVAGVAWPGTPPYLPPDGPALALEGQAGQELSPRTPPPGAWLKSLHASAPEPAGSPLPWQQGPRRSLSSAYPAGKRRLRLQWGPVGREQPGWPPRRRPREAGGQDQRLEGWQGAWPSNCRFTPAATRPALLGSALRSLRGAPAQEGGTLGLRQVQEAPLRGPGASQAWSTSHARGRKGCWLPSSASGRG